MSTRPLPICCPAPRRWWRVAALALLALPLGPAPQSARADWPWSGWLSEEPTVGTPEWWKKNQKKAVFEPFKGWKVEGVDGYFDADGRPIQGPIDAQRISQAGADPAETGIAPGLDPRIQYNRVKSAVGLGPSEQAARDAYAEGERLFQAGKYSAAVDQFKKAADRGAGSSIEPDALFMLAESHFFADRYIKARDAYNALVEKHPNTRYMDALIDRQWKIARYWEQYEQHDPDWVLTPNAYDKTRPWFDTIGHAIKTYENIRLNDPTGPRADDAIMATANIYFQRGKFDQADYHYTLLRREYPRSELQFEAHLLGLQAKLNKYQGADYDGMPLEEAKTLVKQLRMQFANRLSDEERQRLTSVEAQLNQQIAMQTYRIAEYYDNTKYYGSAKIYYKQLIEKHPSSELAEQARQRIAQIGDSGEPDSPPKRLAWFVDLFPQSTERSRVARIPELQGGTRLAQAPAGGAAPANTSLSPQ